MECTHFVSSGHWNFWGGSFTYQGHTAGIRMPWVRRLDSNKNNTFALFFDREVRPIVFCFPENSTLADQIFSTGSIWLATPSGRVPPHPQECQPIRTSVRMPVWQRHPSASQGIWEVRVWTLCVCMSFCLYRKKCTCNVPAAKALAENWALATTTWPGPKY